MSNLDISNYITPLLSDDNKRYSIAITYKLPILISKLECTEQVVGDKEFSPLGEHIHHDDFYTFMSKGIKIYKPENKFDFGGAKFILKYFFESRLYSDLIYHNGIGDNDIFIQHNINGIDVYTLLPNYSPF
jgi:hypothetical protein